MKLTEANYREQFIRSAGIATCCEPASDRSDETRYNILGGKTYKICMASGETRGNYVYWWFGIPERDLKRMANHYIVIACGIIDKFVIIPSKLVIQHIEDNERTSSSGSFKLDLSLSDSGLYMTGRLKQTSVQEFMDRFVLINSTS